MNTELVSQFCRATEHKRALNAELKGVQEEVDTVQAALLEEMVGEGVSRITQNGATVHMIRRMTVRAKDGDQQAAIHGVIAMGDTTYLMLSTQRIASFFRSFESPEEAGPEWTNLFDVGEVVTLGVRGLGREGEL